MAKGSKTYPKVANAASNATASAWKKQQNWQKRAAMTILPPPFHQPSENAAKINEIGEELAEIYHVQHLPSDFKKKNGYKRSIELSHEYDLYRQNYCGCVYSRREAENRK